MSTSEREQVVLSTYGELPVATVAGDEDERRVLSAIESLTEVIAGGDAETWIVDLALVDYLSSAGFGRLVALHKSAESNGVTVRFAALRPEIVEVLEVMRLDEVIRLFPTVMDACAGRRS